MCYFPVHQRVQFVTGDTKKPINPEINEDSLALALRLTSSWASEYGISKESAQILAERHGPEALEILRLGSAAKLKNIWQMEALFAIRNTMCLHLRDFMLRRSPLFLCLPDHGHSLIDGILAVFKSEYAWDDARLAKEKELYFQHENFELGWRNR